MPDFRYRRVGYAALNVPDRQRSETFAHDVLGLRTHIAGPDTAGATLLNSGSSACELALYDGPEPGLRRIAFEMEGDADLEAATQHLRSLRVPVWETSEDERAAFAQRHAVRFAEPTTGLAIELFTPSDEAGAGEPYTPFSNVTRLGHVVINTVDAPAVSRFFLDEMNFRASDYIENVTFMRCFPNPVHHSLAIVPSSENRLNHINFLVESLDDVGRAMWRHRRQNIPIVYGPGRHPPSGSVFLYFLDPDGMTFEFSTGMEEFPEADPREPRRLPKVPESYDYWLGDHDPRHGAVGRFVVASEVAAR